VQRTSASFGGAKHAAVTAVLLTLTLMPLTLIQHLYQQCLCVLVIEVHFNMRPRHRIMQYAGGSA
jgi:hypothetical protein